MLVLSRDEFTALSKHDTLNDMLVRAAELQRKSYGDELEGKMGEQKTEEAATEKMGTNSEEGEDVLKKKKKKKKKKKNKKKGEDGENG